MVKKGIGVVLLIILIGMACLVGMRLLGLSGLDISWLRGSIWLIVILVMGGLAAGVYMLFRPSKQKTI